MADSSFPSAIKKHEYPTPSKEDEFRLRLNFGQAVRRMRMRRGISQVRMARHLRMTRQGYNHIEKGRSPMTMGYGYAIARVLGVTLSEIVAEAVCPDSIK